MSSFNMNVCKLFMYVKWWIKIINKKRKLSLMWRPARPLYKMDNQISSAALEYRWKRKMFCRKNWNLTFKLSQGRGGGLVVSVLTRLQFQRSKFESRWNRLFFLKKMFYRKNENKERGWGWPNLYWPLFY